MKSRYTLRALFGVLIALIAVRSETEVLGRRGYGPGGTLNLDVLTPDQWFQWNEHGYLRIPGFYDIETVNKLREVYNDVWQARHNVNASAHELTIDIIESNNFQRVRFPDADAAARNRPYKLNDLYLINTLVRETVIAGRISHILETLLDAQPVICNSLTFEYGSQQPDHLDSWYMPSRVQNGMVASWIALDPVSETNGPLRYYPGSHKIKPFSMNPEGRSLQEQIVTRSGDNPAQQQKYTEFREYIAKQLTAHGMDKPVLFTAEPGDLLIWHSQLLHGGAPILDGYKKTRKALVTHYHSTRDFLEGSRRLIHVQPGRGYYMERTHQKTAESHPVGA